MSSSPTAAAPPTADPVRDARQAGLVYVSDTEPGITRRRSGKGFCYRLPDGSVLRDADELARIRALAIPPAYTEVWICSHPRGHLQATGRDARRRKQYRYHPQWAETRGLGKFHRVVAFGRALPRLRRRLRRDLREPGFPRDKVLAVVVSLMAETLVRVGNSCYASSNRSYGLTTLRNRHIDFLRGGRARLRFRGKGGLDHDLEIDDAQLVKLVRACQELPGQALFQYHDDAGTLQPVDSSDVNAYLREATGEHFTAKDFRTWGATLEAFRILATTPLPPPSRTGAPSERALAQVRNAVVAEVASVLCNTPSVCRKAYIDPRVFAGWEDGSLARAAQGARGARQWEQAALKFLAGRSRAGTAATTRARASSVKRVRSGAPRKAATRSSGTRTSAADTGRSATP